MLASACSSSLLCWDQCSSQFQAQLLGQGMQASCYVLQYDLRDFLDSSDPHSLDARPCGDPEVRLLSMLSNKELMATIVASARQ